MAKPPNDNKFPAVSWSGFPDRGEDAEKLPQVKGYEIAKKLGEGGMGVVYLAEQRKPIKRTVALKIIKPGMDSAKVIARFEAERQALALLDHPNIARIFDAGTTELDRPYFAMEYVEGKPITDYCDEHRLSIEDRLKPFMQVCEAIQFAHQRGIIHRDIKPSNILVTEIGDQALPKMIDFGVAKAVNQPLTEQTLFTEQGQLIGTPEYMSPEQAGMTQEYVDTRSDVYSLGVLLYELLTGRLPFDHETFREAAFAEILRIIQEQDPPRPSARLSSLGEEAKAVAQKRCTEVVTLVKRLHSELEWIPLMAMRKEPDRRYRTASELANDIENYLQGSPLIAGPESRVYRAKKFVRRNRVLVTGAVAVLVVLTAGIAVSTIFAIKANQEARRAEEEAEAHRYSLYINQIASAKAMLSNAYSNFDLQQIHNLLESSPKDLRGWEWYHLWHTSNLSSMTLRGHTDRVTSVQFSRDGQRILSADRQSNIIVWDMETGSQLVGIQAERPMSSEDLSNLEENHPMFDFISSFWYGRDPPYGTIACFSSDDERIAAATLNKTVRVWDASNGSEVMALQGHSGLVSCIAFSPDGKYLASGDLSGSVKLWDTNSGQELATIHEPNSGVYSLAVSPDSKLIATASSDKRVRIWDAVSGMNVKTFSGPVLTMSCSVRFSPNGRQIVLAGCPTSLWDFTDQQETRAYLFTLKSRAVYSKDDASSERYETARRSLLWRLGDFDDYVPLDIVFGSSGSSIVSGGFSSELGMINIWNATTGGNTFCIVDMETYVADDDDQPRPPGDASLSVAISPDEKRIASGQVNTMIKVWEIPSRTEPLLLEQGSRFHLLSVSPDGKHVMSCDVTGVVCLRSVDTGEMILSRKCGSWNRQSGTVCFSPNSKSAILPNDGNSIGVWDLTSRREIMTLKGHLDSVLCAAFSPNGKCIASGSTDKTIRIWDANTGSELLTIEGHNGSVRSIVFSPYSQRVISASEDKTIRIWNSLNGAEIRTMRCSAHSLMISSDGERLLSCGRTCRLWDITTGIEMMTFDNSGTKFSPDGKFVLSISIDRGTITVWDAETGTEIRRISSHNSLFGTDLIAQITAAAFSPDGKRIVSAGESDIRGMTTIWDADNGTEIMSLEPRLESSCESITFSSDGRRLFSGLYDGTIIVWDSASQEDVAVELQANNVTEASQ